MSLAAPHGVAYDLLAGARQLERLEDLETPEAAQGLDRAFDALDEAVEAGAHRVCWCGSEPAQWAAWGADAEVSADAGRAPPWPGGAPPLPGCVAASRLPLGATAVAYATVPYTHAHSPALTVLACLVMDGRLQHEVRTVGGAYMVSAAHHAQGGLFTLSSASDPLPARSVELFRRVSGHLRDVGAADLNRAILASSRIHRLCFDPESRVLTERLGPQATFSPERTLAYLRGLREVTVQDLRAAADRYLQPERAVPVVLGPGGPAD